MDRIDIFLLAVIAISLALGLLIGGLILLVFKGITIFRKNQKNGRQ